MSNIILLLCHCNYMIAVLLPQTLGLLYIIFIFNSENLVKHFLCLCTVCVQVQCHKVSLDPELLWRTG